MKMPSDQQIEDLVEDLEGVCDLNWLKTCLINHGLSVDLIGNEDFDRKLQEHVYQCECCNTWIGMDIGYIYKGDGEQICEQCDDLNYMDDDEDD